MLKFFDRHGMIVDKFHEIISFEQSMWLGKFIKFNFQKRIKAKNEFGKDLYNLINNAFNGKTMEKVRNRFVLEIF